MIAPISPFTSGDDPYGDVIRSTMEVNFGADERLEVVPSYSAIQKGLYPDFNPAEQAGADLLVAGHYDMEGPDLYLEVVLYETASRRVRYAETYLPKRDLRFLIPLMMFPGVLSKPSAVLFRRLVNLLWKKRWLFRMNW